MRTYYFAVIHKGQLPVSSVAHARRVAVAEYGSSADPRSKEWADSFNDAWAQSDKRMAEEWGDEYHLQFIGYKDSYD